MEGTEEAKVPLMRAFDNLTHSTVRGMNSLMESGSEFVKNAIKIIPGIGDAYIILDNAFQIGIAGTHASSVMTKNADTMVSTVDEISKRIRAKIEPPLQNYESSMDDLNSIRDNLNQLDLSSAIQNTESQIAKSIEDAGNNAATTINNMTPKLKGGKTLKSNLKKRHMKNTKKVRFNL